MSSATNVVWLGFLASLVAGMGTGVGALDGFENLAMFSLLAAFALMMYLDATLG